MIRPQLEEFMRRMAPKAVAIIPGAHDTTRSNDTHYRFRQDSDFFYLTGFEEPDALAVIKPESDKKYTLFVRPRDPEREIWDGRRAESRARRMSLERRRRFRLKSLSRSWANFSTVLKCFTTGLVWIAILTTRSSKRSHACVQ